MSGTEEGDGTWTVSPLEGLEKSSTMSDFVKNMTAASNASGNFPQYTIPPFIQVRIEIKNFSE